MKLRRLAAKRVHAGLLTLVIAAAFVVSVPATSAQPPDRGAAPVNLTVLHFGDVGPSLTDAEHFVGQTRSLYRAADQRGGVVLVGTGDYLAPGEALAASIAHPARFYPSAVFSRLPVDAYALGDNDLRSGPDVFADFVTSFNRRPVVGPIISANVDPGTDPALVDLADSGRFASSAVATTDGQRVALVAVSDPAMLADTALGAAAVELDVARSAQREIDAHVADGINKVVLISHLSADGTRELVGSLHDVDIVIAAGDPEPATTVDLLIDADQQVVLLSAAAGSLQQVGRITVSFNQSGIAIGVSDADPVPVSGESPVDLWTQRTVAQMRSDIALFDTAAIARSQVDLNAVRSDLRSGDTNFGSLVADATLWQAASYAERTGATPPLISLVASDRFRSDTVIDNQGFTIAQTFDAVGDAGNIATVQVSREELKRVLEDAVMHMEDVDGRFPQFAGFTLDLDLGAAAREATLFGVTVEGERVVNLRLDDGTWIVQDGAVVPGESLTVATLDAMVEGDRRYQFASTEATMAGGTLQQALVAYVTDHLDRAISVERYPESGNDRLYLF